MNTTAAANHFVLAGSIDGTVDTSGPAGTPVVDIRLDGNPMANAKVCEVDDGIEVTAVVTQVPDQSTVRLRMLIPRVNVGADGIVFAGVALLITELTTVGGPDLVQGPVHLYDVRPVAGTAEAVQA